MPYVISTAATFAGLQPVKSDSLSSILICLALVLLLAA